MTSRLASRAGSFAGQVRAEAARRARSLARRGVTPGLALILVGDNPSSISYVRSKGDAAEEAGIFSETFHLSDTISQEELTSPTCRRRRTWTRPPPSTPSTRQRTSTASPP